MVNLVGMTDEMTEEEFLEQWQEFYREAVEDHAIEQVEEFYTDVLVQNLEENAHLSHLPDEGIDALAEMAANVYGEQARRILDSEYVGEDEVGLAVATAFLDEKRQFRVGAQAQGLVDLYWGDADAEARRYGKDQYQEWAFEVLTDPWPPHQLEDSWESVNRFKPTEDDPAYQ